MVEKWMLRTVLEGRMEGTRTRERQSATMIDWMKKNDVEYEYIKKKACDREDWRHWRPGPAWKGRAHKRETERRSSEKFSEHLASFLWTTYNKNSASNVF